MPLLWSVHATPSPRGFGKPCVRSVPAALSGVFDPREKGGNGDIMRPDYDAIREALPHQWRKAWDTRGASMWFDKHGRMDDSGKYVGQTPYVRLQFQAGHTVTVYAIPYYFDVQRRDEDATQTL